MKPGMASIRLPERAILGEAFRDTFLKLDPRELIRNPVMFIVEVGSVFASVLFLLSGLSPSPDSPPWFIGSIAIWLWFTVLFANFAEALAEGRGKAQAANLRRARMDTTAKRLLAPERGSRYDVVSSAQLRRDDLVIVEAGDLVPGDGEVIEGIASVDESAITGESAPVIRESGGDRSAVTGGTKILSDWLIVRVTSNPGDSFLDRMISMVENASRQKTPNEISLNIMLSMLTLIFLLVTVTLHVFATFSSGGATSIPLVVLIALLICLIPTTIGGLLSAIGIAGMDRLIQTNVIAMSGRAIEAAGDVDVLMLDKTGTITLGNRQAVAFLPSEGIDAVTLAEAAQFASLTDETPEGRSIVVLAKKQFGIRARELTGQSADFIPFSAGTRMSGVDVDGHRIRKGSLDAVQRFVAAEGGSIPNCVLAAVEQIARSGGTPLVVVDRRLVLGVIHLKDIVKGGIRDRFAAMHRIGIRTVMITGDNPITASAIAAEAGVDDFMAEATPEKKLGMIRELQAGGHLVAMTGDGTNDAPALAQADVAVAMNSGTQAAKEAGNMIDLDSNPTKLLDVVAIGKQMLITRGALTTFSLANDISKYFAIIPAAFASIFPELALLNIMDLHSPQSAVLSAVIFNALIIVALIPLALHGVRYTPATADRLLRRNLLIYGLGGLALPFPCIKLIDLIIQFLGG